MILENVRKKFCTNTLIFRFSLGQKTGPFQVHRNLQDQLFDGEHLIFVLEKCYGLISQHDLCNESEIPVYENVLQKCSGEIVNSKT